MKETGKFTCYANNKKRSYNYTVKKQIPDEYRKVVVFGRTGLGKSEYLIHGAIKDNDRVLYISTRPAKLALDESYLNNEVVIRENIATLPMVIAGKEAYDLGLIPQAKRKEVFYNEVLPYLRNTKITESEGVTVILEDLVWLWEDKSLLNEMAKRWKCKVILDFTCSGFAINEDFTYFFKKKRYWKLIPVFEKLFG